MVLLLFRWVEGGLRGLDTNFDGIISDIFYIFIGKHPQKDRIRSRVNAVQWKNRRT